MNTTTKNTASNTIKMIVVLVVMFVSSGSFAQTAIETPVAATTTTVEANASINMVSWFMGTKQTTNMTKETSSKKQMITSGIAPNRLLIKTFLKKASQYASNVA